MQELLPHVSCMCQADELEEVLKSTYAEVYVPTADGKFMKHVKLPHNRHVRLKVSSLPLGANYTPTSQLDEEVNFLPAGKIPYLMFEQIVELFRQVMKKMKQDFEAHAWILWSSEKGYFISVPKQTVSKASVSFDYDDTSLPPGSVIVVDLHSHNTMGAFYSGTDNNNDKSGIYYSGVIGKLTDTSYEFVFRFNLYEDKKEVKLNEVFEVPDKKIEIDPAWLDNITVKTYQTTSYPHLGQARPLSSHASPLYDSRAGRHNPFAFGRQPDQEGGGIKDKKGKELVVLQNARSGNVKNTQPSSNPPVNPGHEFSGQNSLFDDNFDFYPYSELGSHLGISEVGEDIFVDGPLDKLHREADRDLQAACGMTGLETISNLDEVATMESPGMDDFGPQAVQYEDFEILLLDKYGEDVADAYSTVDDVLTDLANCDPALLDIIKTCYSLLSSAGQHEINTKGIQ